MLITQMFRLEKQRSITIRQAESTHSPQEFPSSEMQGSSPLSTPEDKIPEYIQAKELMPEGPIGAAQVCSKTREGGGRIVREY